MSVNPNPAAASGAAGGGASAGGISEHDALAHFGLLTAPPFEDEGEGDDLIPPETETPEEETGVQWDSDDNPYKAQVSKLEQQLSKNVPASVREGLDSRIAQIDTAGQAILANLMAGPVAQKQMTSEVAQAFVKLAVDNAQIRARWEAERAIIAPAVRSEVARRIAQEFSTKGMKIDPEKLMSEPTAEAMRARAKTLSETTRTESFDKRKKSPADRVEQGGGRLDMRAIEALSPRSKIALGIRRGQ